MNGEAGEGVRVIDRGESPAKRVLTIEQALRWAYRDELPKVRPDGTVTLGEMASAWDKVARYGELNAVIDENPYGVLHDPTALGEPHRDALRISQAVDELAGLLLDVPDDWEPIRDLGDLGEAGEACRARALEKIRTHAPRPRQLVIKYALLRDPPDWQIERPVIRYVCSGNNKPKWFRRVPWRDPETGHMHEQEVDGWDSRARRPHVGAYQKTFLDPDPTMTVIWRAEWQVWVAALDVLQIELEGELESIDVRGSGRPLVPWEEPQHVGRVLPDLGKRLVRPVTLVDGKWEPVDLTPHRTQQKRQAEEVGAIAAAMTKAKRQPLSAVDNPTANRQRRKGN